MIPKAESGLNLLKIWWLFTTGVFLAGTTAFYLLIPFASSWNTLDKILISLVAGFVHAALPAYMGVMFWLDDRSEKKRVERVKRFVDRLK